MVRSSLGAAHTDHHDRSRSTSRSAIIATSVVTLCVCAATAFWFVYYFVLRIPIIENRLETVASVRGYECSLGQCTPHENGQYSTYDECMNACDRATCITTTDGGGECTYMEGHLEFGTMAECQETCGAKDESLSYVCDNSVGCRLAAATEVGQYATSSCDGQCLAFDVSGNMCVAVPWDTSNGAENLSQAECENRYYTATCDPGTSVCVDDGMVKNDALSHPRDECVANCNPEKYPVCDVGDTAPINGVPKTYMCAGKSYGQTCSVVLYGVPVSGTCRYCVDEKTAAPSSLYCSEMH